ncbi:MAG TPA: hypothetical protein VG871_18230, partial [Vicinamibacterales bacterium]|nr:hypothetical protein [Vicinamibacterales bacterium]
RGRDEIWWLFDIIARREPIGHLQRGGYLTDGRQPHAARDLVAHADDHYARDQPADVAPLCRERSERDEQRRRRGIKESVTQLFARPRA